MKLLKCLSAPALLLVVLAGCGLNRPSEDLGKKVLQERLGNQFTVLDFQKTDGKSLDVLGVKSYEMNFKGTMRVEQTIEQLSPDDIKEHMFESNYFLHLEYLVARLADDKIWLGWRGSKVGQIVPISGTISFSKSEEGWSGSIDSDF
jgi:hypothetical protein